MARHELSTSGAFTNVQQLLNYALFEPGVLPLQNMCSILTVTFFRVRYRQRQLYHEQDRAKVKAVFLKLAGSPTNQQEQSPRRRYRVGPDHLPRNRHSSD